MTLKSQSRCTINPERYLRSFDVLSLLSQQKNGLRLTEIKSALQLPPSSVHNMLQTMVAVELLTLSGNMKYNIGPKAVGISLTVLGSLDIRKIARKHLLELAKKIGDDVYLALRVGQRVFYADRSPGTQRISLDIRLGEPLFMHCTATGKLFAAFDPSLEKTTLHSSLKELTPYTITDPKLLEQEFKRIRTKGYAKSNQEAVEGVVGVAVPLRQENDQIIAAIHVSVIEKRANKSHETKLIKETLECAKHIERSLGGLSF
jgi:DNA-binding IclR family transcriptional regulator